MHVCYKNEWNGMEWNGMEWNGVEWSGVEWNGVEWNGMECNVYKVMQCMYNIYILYDIYICSLDISKPFEFLWSPLFSG